MIKRMFAPSFGTGVHLSEVSQQNAQSQQPNPPDVCEIDVNHLPIIKNNPLDDNFSLDCNIMNNGFPNEVSNTNNTSDNETTALIPTRFPEYKH